MVLKKEKSVIKPSLSTPQLKKVSSMLNVKRILDKNEHNYKKGLISES